MRYCGREFETSEINWLRQKIGEETSLSRYRLSTLFCDQFNWRRPDGKLKDMSCRVAMLRMEKDGLIHLPAPKRNKPVTYGQHPEIELQAACPEKIPEIDLHGLRIEEVAGKRDSLIWNALIQHHHYLGHQLLPGAQLRYFIYSQDARIALLSFGASAWKIKPRDAYIGWNPEQRQRNLHRIVNNARFLILPWIRTPNLASKILAMVSKRITNDWQARYSYRPVLLETFVEDQRFRGTCYQAANWKCLGKTQGRGKLDRFNLRAAPIKSIWVFPLAKNFQQHLCS